MSEYVVDTSIVIQHLVNELHTPNVNTLFDEVGQSINLYVPEFCLLECSNVLWKHVRFQGVSQSDAEQLIRDLMGLNLTIIPVVRLMSRALKIGLTHQLAIYDSVFIALAEQLTKPLISDDMKQVQAARAEGIAIKAITDFKP